VSCNCVPFIKWTLCSHVVAYSNAYSLDIYGKEYRQSNKFVKKIKKGAKPKLSGRYKLASSARLSCRSKNVLLNLNNQLMRQR